MHDADSASEWMDATVAAIRDETKNVKTFKLLPAEERTFVPGQYVLVAQPGLRSAPMAIASGTQGEHLELTVRRTGELTESLFARGPGDVIRVSGPLGRGFPLERAGEGRPLYLLAGGTGIAPVRSLILTLAAAGDTAQDMHLFYGCRDPGDIIYQSEIETWPVRAHVTVDTVDVPGTVVDVPGTVDVSDATWTGLRGNVGDALDQVVWRQDGLVFACGPELMEKAVVAAVRQRGLSPENIFVSLERFDGAGKVLGPVLPVSDPRVGF